MGAVMKASGLTTTWRVWESIFGTMAASIQDNIKTTRNMDLEFTLGLMRGAIWDSGTKENNMD